MYPEATLDIKLPQAGLRLFTVLFHTGVGIKTAVGISLMGLLRDQLGIGSDTIRQLVQTVFINGRAVDNFELTSIPADAVVSLSAAMPGLVGATLRSGGVLAGLRQGISYSNGGTQPNSPTIETIIHLKLFNLVAETLAPHLLRHGVWVTAGSLQNVMKQTDIITNLDNGEIKWNGCEMTITQFNSIEWPKGWVAVKATPSDDARQQPLQSM